MTDREIMEQALEALEEGLTSKQLRELTTALRERLAQPVQVPVAEFVEMVLEKEHLVGKPLVWAQWPNEEKNA